MFLCYNTPANMSYFGWENEALPLGNGRIGAKIFGQKECELITFNEKTLWSGGKDVPGFNYGISNSDEGKSLKEVQELLFEGRNKDAAVQMQKLEGNQTGFGSYQAFGSLYINFENMQGGDSYVRDLDLDSASAMVTFKKEEVNYTRHYFVSYPDNVFVGRLECANKKEDDERVPTFSFDAYFVSEQKGVPYSEGDTIFLEGTVNANIGVDAEPGENKNSMKYGCAIKFIAPDGTITAGEDGHIRVEDAGSVIIIASFATDYINDFPNYSDGSNPLRDKAIPCVEAASAKTFGELYRAHLADYRELFNKVKFSLGEESIAHPTDYMLKRFGKKGEYKRNLITTLFQYGRYLLISSSRDGTLPANLQGIWNAKNDPPWESDYHLNINLQMNYWPAYVTNLFEPAEPFIDFINSLKKPGRIVAQNYLGIGEKTADGEVDYTKPTGWAANTMVTPLGIVAPGTSWRWGWAPVNGAWTAVQMFDGFLFTKDVQKLKDKIYPTVEEAALLWSSLLREDTKSGRLVVSPCFSPEHGPVSMGGTFEQSIIYALFDAAIEGAEAMKEAGFGESVNEKLIEKIKLQKEKLMPYSVGKYGQIKEWYDEDSFPKKGKQLGVEKGHRHISHLLGLYPFNIINDSTPELMKAAKVSLDDRGIKTTGWALAHRLNCYARLHDGKKCDEIIARILETTILKNLWGTHPPFQIDGNFGFTAGVAEMLLQSHGGVIRILPALPDSWNDGEYSGLVARGNFVVSAKWKDDRLQEGTIKSVCGGRCNLCYDGKVMLIHDEDGNEIKVDFNNGVSSFDTVAGATYTFA